MLEGLDSVAWNELIHAYGPAKDVPDQIRNLKNPAPEAREQALCTLYSNIFHQGTRYQASVPAIPFLIELVEAPDTPDRAKILRLLVRLALGYEESYLPGGIDPSKFREELQEADARLSPEERADCAEFGFGADVELRCYDAVANGVPIYQRLMREAEPELRLTAAYTLAWFPEDARGSLSCIFNLLESEEEPDAVANLVLSAGLLAHSQRSCLMPAVTSALLTHSSALVRRATALAIGLNVPSPAVIQQLVELLEDPSVTSDTVLYNEGNLAGYAALVLAQAPEPDKASKLDALCKALPKQNAMHSLDITQALLTVITAGKEISNHELSFESLDAADRTALRWIADHGGWKVGGALFGNYGSLVAGFGLPRTQEGLRTYLRTGRTPPPPAARTVQTSGASSTASGQKKEWWQFWRR